MLTDKNGGGANDGLFRWMSLTTTMMMARATTMTMMVDDDVVSLFAPRFLNTSPSSYPPTSAPRLARLAGVVQSHGRHRGAE